MFISIILVLSLFLVIVVINEQLDNCSTRSDDLGQWHQLTSGPVQQEVVILGRLLGGFSAWKDTPAALTIAWVFNQLITYHINKILIANTIVITNRPV